MLTSHIVMNLFQKIKKCFKNNDYGKDVIAAVSQENIYNTISPRKSHEWNKNT